jgi:uncharacterized protein (DUF58 family)
MNYSYFCGMEAQELLKKVHAIEIKTRHRSEHLLMGGYHAAFKGQGMSFSEVRPYQFGDDVRSIDWNVTARTGTPHIKVFEEERELQVLLVVDVSASAFFGTGPGQSKQDFLTELTAMLAFSAIQNHDKVGLLLFSDQPELYLPPKTGRQHVLRIIRELLSVQERPMHTQTSLTGACKHIQQILKKRSVVLMLSDFLTQEQLLQPLRGLAHRHDVAGIMVWDERERLLPDIGVTAIRDPESGQMQWVDTTDPALRRQYTKAFDAQMLQTQQTFRNSGADLVQFTTQSDYVQPLIKFFEQRAHRG